MTYVYLHNIYGGNNMKRLIILMHLLSGCGAWIVIALSTKKSRDNTSRDAAMIVVIQLLSAVFAAALSNYQIYIGLLMG